jgi:hypothetical protein
MLCRVAVRFNEDFSFNKATHKRLLAKEVSIVDIHALVVSSLVCLCFPLHAHAIQSFQVNHTIICS